MSLQKKRGSVRGPEKFGGESVEAGEEGGARDRRKTFVKHEFKSRPGPAGK